MSVTVCAKVNFLKGEQRVIRIEKDLREHRLVEDTSFIRGKRSYLYLPVLLFRYMLDIYHILKCESFISIILIQNHTKAIYKFNLHHYMGKRNKIFQNFCRVISY